MLNSQMFAEIAKKRNNVFQHLEDYTERICKLSSEIDPNVEIYIFGSVLKGTNTASSDIDLLIITDSKKNEILKVLFENGIRDPFELHVRNKEESKIYLGHIRELKRLL